MTMHYGETITAEEIIEGWKYHGETTPLAYGTFSWGDQVAYNCWHYLCLLKQEGEETHTPEKFFSNAPEDKQDELVQILKDTIEQYNKLPPNWVDALDEDIEAKSEELEQRKMEEDE